MHVESQTCDPNDKLLGQSTLGLKLDEPGGRSDASAAHPGGTPTAAPALGAPGLRQALTRARRGARPPARAAAGRCVTSAGRCSRWGLGLLRSLLPTCGPTTSPSSLDGPARLLRVALGAKLHVGGGSARPGQRGLLLTELPGLCLPGGHWAAGLPRNPRRRGPQG